MYWLKTNAISQNMIQRYLSLPNLAAAKRLERKFPIAGKSINQLLLSLLLHLFAERFGSLSSACLFC